MVRQGKNLNDEFREYYPDGETDYRSLIRLYWSLVQMQSSDEDKIVGYTLIQNRKLIAPENLKFLNDVQIHRLDSKHFIIFK